MKTLRVMRVRKLGGIMILALAGSSIGFAWTPGTYPAASSNFSVDTQIRNDVVSFWHGVYQASEGYWNRHGWTGNYTATSPYDSGVGTTSAAFAADVERRINYYRAMGGVPAATHVNTGATVLTDAADPKNLYHPTSSPPLAASTTKSAAAQRAAYMIIRTYGYADATGVHPPLGGDVAGAYAGLYHEPDSTKCVAWTTASWNANHLGNLSLGFYGPGAIDAFMAEDVSGTTTWNVDTGHRRMLLHPVSTDFATGDTPGQFDSVANAVRPPTNVTYVAPKTTELLPVAPTFVTYPPAGYFPASLNPGKYWSLSRNGAGFAAATVTMTTSTGTNIPVTVVSRSASFGYPAIIWQISGTAAAVKSVTADTTFNVTIAGITGVGVPATHSYAVTLINPDQITSDQSLLGASSVALGSTPTYRISPPQMAEAIQIQSAQPVTTAWTEGAEDTPTPRVIGNTTGSYELRSPVSFSGVSTFKAISGAKSFRLAFPVSIDPRLSAAPGQSFELDRDILPGTGATLTFKYRRGYFTTGSTVAIESSSDGGVTWSQLGDTIIGKTDSTYDAAALSTSRTLAASAVPIRIRFRLFVASGAGVYSHENIPTYPNGIFFDDITTTNCQWLDLKKSNDLAGTASQFQLNATTAGVALTSGLQLRLRMRTKLGDHWMPFGEMKSVAINTAQAVGVPVFNPPSGEYPAGQPITITGESNSTIYYRINGGATQSANSPVTGITVPAYPGTLSISAYAQKAGLSDSALVEATYTASSALETWENTYFPGISDPAIIGLAADPDQDGQCNLLEYGLGGNPSTCGNLVKTYAQTGAGLPTDSLVLTLAVRAGTPVFTGTPSVSATHEGITYAILGGLTPSASDGQVSIVTPAQTSGLPAAPAGYEYRSFKLNSSTGLPAAGFLRARITATP